jgi:peptidoglycan/LPS O-acetylase OafA/YrhL
MLFFALPDIREGGLGTALSFPVAAIMCSAAVSLAFQRNAVSRALATPPIRFLGQISFGLYVFHFVGIFAARRIVGDASLLLSAVAFPITVALAGASYYVLERPFLQMKDRLAAVTGRKANTPRPSPRRFSPTTIWPSA